MPRFIAIGEAMGELSDATGDSLALGFAGDVFNTLAYASLLGGAGWKCGFVSALGDDPLSERFALRCSALGIREHCARMAGKSIGLYLIHTDDEGERSFSYWRSDSAARQLVNQLTDNAEEQLQAADLILFSGITLAILDKPQREQLFSMLERVRQNGAHIVFDPNYRPRLWHSADDARHWIGRAYRHADTLMIGLDEHQSLYGDIEAAALLDETATFGASTVVIKAGEQGVFIRADNTNHHTPFEPATTVVDTTAAGDSFTAGWLVARAAGLDGSAAAGFAAAVACAVVGQRGAIIDAAALPRLNHWP